jgi:hypothetical protein
LTDISKTCDEYTDQRLNIKKLSPGRLRPVDEGIWLFTFGKVFRRPGNVIYHPF